jgi:hypothetical protein
MSSLIDTTYAQIRGNLPADHNEAVEKEKISDAYLEQFVKDKGGDFVGLKSAFPTGAAQEASIKAILGANKLEDTKENRDMIKKEYAVFENQLKDALWSAIASTDSNSAKELQDKFNNINTLFHSQVYTLFHDTNNKNQELDVAAGQQKYAAKTLLELAKNGVNIKKTLSTAAHDEGGTSANYTERGFARHINAIAKDAKEILKREIVTNGGTLADTDAVDGYSSQFDQRNNELYMIIHTPTGQRQFRIGEKGISQDGKAEIGY